MGQNPPIEYKPVMLKALTIALVTAMSLPCFAGIRDVGNGGVAAVVDGKLYLQDLVEAGVHKNPYFDFSLHRTSKTLPVA